MQEWIDTLERQGIAPFKAAISVLREFGGLKINVPFREDAAFGIRSGIVFDPILGGDGEADRTARWADRLGKRVYPLGQCGGDMTMVTEDGRILDLHPDGVLVIGDSIWEAFHLWLIRPRLPTLIHYTPLFSYNAETREWVKEPDSE